MLDNIGKLFERLIRRHLDKHLETSGDLAENQFCVRKGRSTVDAIEAALTVARFAARGAVQYRHLYATVTIFVRNAFNTAPWDCIDEALGGRGVPLRLRAVLRSYMDARKFVVGQ